MGAYVPPHRRQNAGPAARGGDLPDFERKNSKHSWTMDISYSDRALVKLYVLCSEDEMLVFQVFDSGARPFSGLYIHRPRYRLSILDSHERKEGRDAFIPPLVGGLVEDLEALGQGQRLTARLKEDFRAALDEFSSFRQPNSLECVRPQLWLRFGRITFYREPTHSNAELEEIPAFLPGDIEREHQRGGMKTWDINTRKELNPAVSQEFFDRLQMLALQCGEDKLSIKEKEVFILKIGGEATRSIYCYCKSDGDTLKIHKFKGSPRRFLVADSSWVGQWDLRLMFSSETDLSEEEKEDAAEIVSAAVVDPRTTGGIRWLASFRGRSGLVVRQLRHLKFKKIDEQSGRVWKFIQARSYDYASGEVRGPSLEVDLRSRCWKTILKDVKEQTDEVGNTILQTFPEIMAWVYRHCLSVKEPSG